MAHDDTVPRGDQPLWEYGRPGFDPGLMPAAAAVEPAIPGARGVLRITRGHGEAGEGGWCVRPDGSLVDVEDRLGRQGKRVRRDVIAFLDAYLTGKPLPEAERG